ncbi:MAG TPA: hypothetical protein HA360_00085 [Nanoarchaeota archaeon]|nr:hypothetical protein [Candidatus Woesearchaeota archaeon]HIH15343.1 hypothetical protein [Nanoarchaeota archaeon]HIH59233.1 hypothetical protein [Nanoarchaeota archaeon]HII13452.1 hypothetical protein [Nanoarchaeota archaeon]HIJ05541.1 hypothetical protein [Nanoarchaeota archaeon]
MKYKTKSVLIARKKESGDDFSRRPCFISLFDENNPHLNTQGPKEVVEFEKIHKVVIKGLNIDYLLPGNDIVINNLTEIEIEVNNDHVYVTGKQE